MRTNGFQVAVVSKCDGQSHGTLCRKLKIKGHPRAEINLRHFEILSFFLFYNIFKKSLTFVLKLK